MALITVAIVVGHSRCTVEDVDGPIHSSGDGGTCGPLPIVSCDGKGRRIDRTSDGPVDPA